MKHTINSIGRGSKRVLETKKLLVAFNPAEPTAKSGDFLLPVVVDGVFRFVGLSSGRVFDYGMLVMIERGVTVDDVFGRLMDSGQMIQDMDKTRETIADYFALLNDFKISNVLRVEHADSRSGFRLIKTEFKRSTKRKGLP